MRRTRQRVESGATLVTHGGMGFATDLYELERAAKAHIPAVSVVYGGAIASCGRVPPAIAEVMQRPTHFGGDPFGPVLNAYMELHDSIVSKLKETKISLDDTAVALSRAAHRYADADQSVNAEFKRLIQADSPAAGD